MAFNISYRFQVLDKFSKPLRQMQKQLKRTQQKVRNLSKTMKSTGISTALQKIANKTGVAARAMGRFAAATGRAMRDAARKVKAFAKKAGKRLRDVGRNLTAKLSLPISILGGFALKASAKTETMTVAFKSMLGSLGKAKNLVKDVRAFTAKTPFQFGDVGGATRQLLAFGVVGEKVLGKLKFLGDIAAGAGVPLSDMAQIFGKVKAKGKAMTEEILQASERGIPIIAELAKVMKRPQSSILDLASKSKISFKIFEKALKSMTEKGGIFFNQTEEQSNTLSGIFSTLVDNIENILSDVGDELVKAFSLKQSMKDFILFLQNAGEKFKAFAKANPQLTKMLFVFTAIAAVMGPLLIGLGFMATGLAVLLSPVALIVAAIVGFGAGLAILTAKSQKVRDAFSRLGKAFEPIINSFRFLGSSISKALGLTGDFSISFETMENIAVAAIDGITTGVMFLMETIRNAVQLFSEFKKGFSEKLSGIKSFFGFETPSLPPPVNDNEVRRGPRGAAVRRGPRGVPVSTAIAAQQRLNARMDGDITVRATPGTEVKRTESTLRGARGNLGLNIAGVGG